VNETLRAAIIGVGAMGQHHVRVYRDLSNVELVGVADGSDAIRTAVEQRYNVRGYADFVEMLEQARPQLVSVAVPTAFHLDVAREVIQRGIHVLIEKPIAETAEDGQTLIDLARQHNVVLAVGHIERHNPAVRALKTLLDRGEVGPIFEMRAERVGPFPHRIRDVGVVLDLATHDIDVITHLASSQLLRVYAETQQKIHSTREDMLSGMMRFANGVTGILHVNWLTPAKNRRLTVTGARGLYEVDYITQDLTFYENGDFYENGQTLKNFEDLQLFRGVSEGRMIRDKIEKREPLRIEIEDYVQAVREGRRPRVTGEESLQVLKIAHSLVDSGKSHQVIEMSACAPV
jgi:UDP-N-acetylglucosamine 3-dehydrogenase